MEQHSNDPHDASVGAGAGKATPLHKVTRVARWIIGVPLTLYGGTVLVVAPSAGHAILAFYIFPVTVVGLVLLPRPRLLIKLGVLLTLVALAAISYRLSYLGSFDFAHSMMENARMEAR